MGFKWSSTVSGTCKIRCINIVCTAFLYELLIHFYMMTSSKGNPFHVTGLLCGEFTGHRWIPLTKASDAELWCFLWSAPWINGWVNNREAGDLRRHRAHYDVTAMILSYVSYRRIRTFAITEFLQELVHGPIICSITMFIPVKFNQIHTYQWNHQTLERFSIEYCFVVGLCFVDDMRRPL